MPPQRRSGRELRPLRTVNPPPDTCSYDGCDRRRRSRGLCGGHNRVLRTEGALRPLRHKSRHGATLKERFESHCGSSPPSPEGCWTWEKSQNGDGYGSLHFTEPGTGIKRSMAHQAAWVLTHGPIPVGEELHHTCGRGAQGCCNPDHLQLVTSAENAAEMRARGAYLRRIAALERQVEQLTAQLDDATRCEGCPMAS